MRLLADHVHGYVFDGQVVDAVRRKIAFVGNDMQVFKGKI